MKTVRTGRVRGCKQSSHGDRVEEGRLRNVPRQNDEDVVKVGERSGEE